MSDEINDGGPAFPVPEASQSNVVNGMSLRDWFAGLAMQGLVSRIPVMKSNSGQTTIAQDCYELADIMLKTRGQ